METNPSCMAPPCASSQSSAWLMIGTPKGRAYSIARRYSSAFITHLPSSEKATQPASACSASSASCLPSRLRVTAPIGYTRTTPSTFARARM